MKHFLNDLAHIVFTVGILSFTMVGWWGYPLSGLFIGMLAEVKEENSNVLKVSYKEVCWRDVLGYVLGGLIIGIITHFKK